MDWDWVIENRRSRALKQYLAREGVKTDSLSARDQLIFWCCHRAALMTRYYLDSRKHLRCGAEPATREE